MPTQSISVRWNPLGSVASQVRRSLDAGFERVGILSPLYRAEVDDLVALLPADSVCCVEVFQPLPRDIRPGQPSPFRLGSSSVEDKRDAVEWGQKTIQFAERHGIPTVWVPPRGLDDELRAAHLRYLQGPRLATARSALRASRSASLGTRPFDSFLSVLAKLLDRAADAGVTVALTPGGWIDELPDLREARACVEEFRGAPLGLWPDTANLELAEEIFADEATGGFAAVHPGPCDGSELPVGVRIRDLHESGDPAFPGEGVLDWSRRAALLGASPVWLVDPPGTLSPERLAEAVAFLDGLTPRQDYDPFRR